MAGREIAAGRVATLLEADKTELDMAALAEEAKKELDTAPRNMIK